MEAYAGLTSSLRQLARHPIQVKVWNQFPWDVFQDADEPPAVVEPEEAEVRGEDDRWYSKL